MTKTIQQIIEELNKSGDKWVPASGVHALTLVNKNNNDYQFNPASGVLVKVFLNTRTGEIKLFPAKLITDSF